MPGLEGKVALVTGGGSGLGAATCRVLACEGARVVVADVREGAAERVAACLLYEGLKAMALALDVRDEGSARRAVEEVMSRHGRIDVLINSAGTDVTLPVDELALEEWDNVTAVNLRGPFVMSRAVLPDMKRRGGGDIVNIVSTAAKRAWPNASAYHASKWGLLGLSHALHAELRPCGIKVTAVVAGGMRTPFLLDRFPDIDPAVLQEPENVARTIAFVLKQPAETVIPEIMVLPMKETSWP